MNISISLAAHLHVRATKRTNPVLSKQCWSKRTIHVDAAALFRVLIRFRGSHTFMSDCDTNQAHVSRPKHLIQLHDLLISVIALPIWLIDFLPTFLLARCSFCFAHRIGLNFDLTVDKAKRFLSPFDIPLTVKLMRLKQLAQVDFRREKWKDKAEGDDSRASSALTTE